jgi:ATP-dependent helicase/nuclease subunit A
VAGFWTTPFGRAAAAAPQRLHRELPFVLTLAEGDFTLHLRGQIDLLVEAEGGATVVDYKAARRPPQGLAAYRFQLGCYALAARHFLGDGAGPVRAGISFLREADRAPQLLSVQDTESAVEGAALVREARALAQAQVSGAFEGRALATCEALGCGYRYRCHPSAASAPQ